MLLVASKAKELNDRELLGLYSKKGDQQAFALVVRRHLDMVIGICRRSALPASDIDDVCQAVFILLSRKARAISWQPSIANWLYATTRHMVAKTCRSNRRFKRLVANHGGNESTGKSDELSVLELFTALDEELERLPAIYREALVLFYFEELSRKEIATQLGLGVGTIKIRLERARHQLAQRLERRGVMLGLTAIMLSANVISAQANTFVGTVLNAVNGDGSLTAYKLVKGVAAMHVLVRGVVVGMTLFSLIGIGVGWATLSKATGQAAEYAMHQEQKQSPVQPLVEPPDPVPQEGEWIPCCTYSPDGKWLALSFGRSKKIVQFNTTTWKSHLSWKSEYTCYSMCYSADSRQLFAVSMDGAILVWDTHTGKLQSRVDANSGICTKLLLSADSKLLVSVHQDGDARLLGSDRFTSDQAKNKIHLWDTSSLSLTRTIILPEAALLPESVCMSRDCKVLAAGYHADFLKDGKKRAGFHGVIEWDVQTGRELRRIDTPRISKGATPVAHTLAYTHDGKWLVIGGGEAIPSEDGAGFGLLNSSTPISERR
ncbi:MAG: sigma-70 family RNA polymerase sigma factor [Gemmatales bacterium]